MTSGTNYRWVTAVAAAVVVGLLTAIVAPRIVGEAAGWALTLGLALAAGALVAFATRETTDDGAHVRDDTLDR